MSDWDGGTFYASDPWIREIDRLRLAENQLIRVRSAWRTYQSLPRGSDERAAALNVVYQALDGALE